MALGILAPLACVAAPWHASAQQVNPISDAASRAGAEAWFNQYIEPDLGKLLASDQGEALTVPLEPGEHPGSPATRTRQLGSVGPLGMLVLDVDVPQQRGEWNDALQPQMFRLYFEPTPPPPVRVPTLPSDPPPGA